MNTEPQTAVDAVMLNHTAGIVAAYVGRNPIAASDLPKLIADVHASVLQISGAPPAPVDEPVALEPAVPVKKSIFPDFIICLDDGLKFKSLKRHIAALGMTPEMYRKKWNLPSDYPMVCPNYSATRSALAKASGLGTK